MNRRKFLRRLRMELRGIPRSEINASLAFFDETISERMERGMSEEEAVAVMGSPEKAAAGIIEDMNGESSAGAAGKRKFSRGMLIAMIICASPILICLLAVAVSIAIAALAAYISVVIALFAAAVGLAVCALGCVALCFVPDGVNMLLGIGAGFICAGLAILFAICGIAIIRGTLTVRLVKRERSGRREAYV